MTQPTTLLQTKDIIEYTGMKRDFPPCDLRNIKTVERKEFRECLGNAFYNVLLGDLATPTTVDYVAGDTYNAGDFVVFEGCIYVALTTTTQLPTVTTDWMLANRFNTECYNDLWCEVLAMYLSYSVLKNRLVFMANKITGKGILKQFGQDSQPAESGDVRSLQIGIDRNISMTFENMDEYMKDNNESGCFDLYKGIANGCCSDCGCVDDDCRCNCKTAKRRKNRYHVG